MSSIWFYQFLDDLPPIPQHWQNAALALAHDQQRSTADLSNNSTILPEYNRNIITPDRVATVSRRTPRWELSAEFEHWVKDNVCQDFIDAAVSISQGDSDITGIHTDNRRHFTLMYLLETSNSGQITAWWQENGHPVQRSERGYYLDNWDNVTKLAEVEFPLQRWIAFNAGILHSIHNIQGSRIGIHVSLPADPFTDK
jgi:hypothetical protein